MVCTYKFTDAQLSMLFQVVYDYLTYQASQGGAFSGGCWNCRAIAKATLHYWISQGSEWESHWSRLPSCAPQVPCSGMLQ
jgi:hypothetical protein